MKLTLLITLALSLAVTLHARTWTSADGSQTFEATPHAYDPETGMVTVIRPNGSSSTFSKDVLSAADIEFLSTWTGREGGATAGAGDLSKIHEQVAKTRLHRFDGRRYQRAELDKKPEYFILYYSASW